MVGSHKATEVNYHVRSISLPSRLHPSLPKIEKELKRLKTWEASSHSHTEAIKEGLRGLAELYNCVEELVGCSLTQQALIRHEGKHVEKALDMSLGLLDTCGLARELLSSMKEHVLDLQSALRRKGADSSVNSQICAYICFRKRARKDITKRLKALKTMESDFKSCSYPLLDLDHHLVMVINVLREISKITISVFRKLLHFLCAPVLKKNTSGWLLFTKIVSTRDDKEKRFINEMEDIDIILCSFHKRFKKIDAKSDVQIVKRRLGEVEGSIRELEVGLDGLFSSSCSRACSPLKLLPFPHSFTLHHFFFFDTLAKRKLSDASQNGTVSLHSSRRKRKTKRASENSDVCFLGQPIPAAEARATWPHHYSSEGKKKVSTSKEGKTKSGSNKIVMARCHYLQARVDGVVYNLNDHAYVRADGEPDYIARIVELFETVNKDLYFTAQWFYRTEDTIISVNDGLVDKKRVFISDVKDDNHLDCIISKVKIVQVTPHVDLSTKQRKIPSCDLYYDMKYAEAYVTFSNIVNDTTRTNSDSASTISCETESNGCVDGASLVNGKTTQNKNSDMSEWSLLDLYSGCGAMSTGLCLGASLAKIKLVTRWAVDINEHACKSLKLNHPETQVRNESTENFLNLLKAWAELCKDFSLVGSEQSDSDPNMDEDEDEVDNEAVVVKNEESETQSDDEEFEVEKFVAICYGDPNNIKEPGLYFKVRWLGYGSSYDTWEPKEGLSDCQEVLKDFVTKGYKKKILPLPGDATFICGGPPCQGISGYNRYRNLEAPLEDTKNMQMLIYMDIIDFLKPKYVLMENVVDLLKFSGGYLGCFAIGRLVAMNYQARYGILAAGSYGLAQFRMRVFLWGALPTEKLPPYPLPTHDVVPRGPVPIKCDEITVACNTEEKCLLAKGLLLEDAIADLPPVANDESLDERKYEAAARSEFQKFIRLKKNEMVGTLATAQSTRRILYDHRPLLLNQDDYDRVCQIPKKKGANFRDLSGVLVINKKSELDPSVERVCLKSGKPLVPDYAMQFVKGTSSKPFGRLWWDEIVSTVVTRAKPHNQIILHPTQDRVLTIRENARLQGFPDCYRLCGPVKERYIQVGNAVAVPVAIAMGYTFGLACQGLCDDNKPLITLPFKYPNCLASSSFAPTEIDDDSS